MRGVAGNDGVLERTVVLFVPVITLTAALESFSFEAILLFPFFCPWLFFDEALRAAFEPSACRKALKFAASSSVFVASLPKIKNFLKILNY